MHPCLRSYNIKNLMILNLITTIRFDYARLSVNGGSDKHSFRKDSAGGYGRSRYSKSPEQMDGTFSMTTIEEEQENLSIALSLKNLSQIDDRTSIHSLKECSDD